MPSVYTTEAALTLRVGSERLTALADRDRDGSADAGVIAAAITRAGDRINRRLAQRYGSGIPFADVTDSPATPGEIQEIAEDLALAFLYETVAPRSDDHVHHSEAADKALERIRTGKDDVAGTARPTASEGEHSMAWDNEAPVFAGVDSSDTSRTHGI